MGQWHHTKPHGMLAPHQKMCFCVYIYLLSTFKNVSKEPRGCWHHISRDMRNFSICFFLVSMILKLRTSSATLWTIFTCSLDSYKHDPNNPGAVGTTMKGVCAIFHCFFVLSMIPKLRNTVHMQMAKRAIYFLNSYKHDPNNPGAVGTTIVGICAMFHCYFLVSTILKLRNTVHAKCRLQ